MTWNEYDSNISILGILESLHPKVTLCHVTKQNKRAIARQGSNLKNVSLHQFLCVPRCAVLPTHTFPPWVAAAWRKKVRSNWWLFPTRMAGSRELKFASEAMEQIKVQRARFQEALMLPPPQKRLRTVPRGSTYQGKLSSSILITMLSAGIAALAHRKKEIACQDAKQIVQKIVTYGPQNGSKFRTSKWVPCNQLSNLSCIWKLGMAPETGSKK